MMEKDFEDLTAAWLGHVELPAERQSAEFSKWLALGSNLLRKSEAAGKRTTRDGASRKLADLKASIPVKADEKVMELGREVYARESHCATCHQPHGQGLPNLYPPLDGSQWVTGSEERLIRMRRTLAKSKRAKLLWVVSRIAASATSVKERALRTRWPERRNWPRASK